MPEVDGFEVPAYMKKNKPRIQIQAAVISGIDSIKDVIAALRKGAVDFLLKPIEDLSILDHTINKVLETSMLRKQNIEYQADGTDRSDRNP